MMNLFYEVHCRQCDRMERILMSGPPRAGMVITCSECVLTQFPGLNSNPSPLPDPREWVGATCVECLNEFKYPRYLDFPTWSDPCETCRRCFLNRHGISMSIAKAEAITWENELNKRSLTVISVPSSKINTGPCPPEALRPDSHTQFLTKFTGLSNDVYVTKMDYVFDSTGVNRPEPRRKLFWHPSSPSVTEIRMPMVPIGGDIRMITVDRHTGRLLLDTSTALDDRIVKMIQDKAKINTNPTQAAIDNLIAAWDNNRSLADAIDALRPHAN